MKRGTSVTIGLVVVVVLVLVALFSGVFNPKSAPASMASGMSTSVPPTAESKEEVVKGTTVVKETGEKFVVVTATPAAEVALNTEASQPLASSTGSFTQTATGTLEMNGWKITTYPGATAEMLEWVFKKVDAPSWPEFPNVTNTIGRQVYPASQGLEYGMAESVFCQQDQDCDFPVAAMHYRIISGDYDLPGVGESCSVGEDGVGCAIMFINVGRVTSIFRGQMVDVGFTVTGRYWDGNFLPQAIWAGLSHTAYNMLNLSSDTVNAGANCSVPEGCQGVKLTFVVISGNEVLMKGITTVYPPVG